jgi:2-polyprenylphenol 6-hydroxylase
MAREPQVVIVGGGPIGTCMANLLAREPGCDASRIALVEARLPSPPANGSPANGSPDNGSPDNGAPAAGEIDLRVFAISRATERILRACGAWEAIGQRHLSAYERMCVWDHDAEPHGVGSIHFDCADLGEPNLGYIVENRRLQWALFQRAREKGITVEHAALQGVELGADHVSVVLSNGRTLRTGLLIAADGADSPTRQALGVTMTDTTLGQAIVTHVRTERPHARTAWQRFLASGPVALLPLHDGRSSIVWSTTPEMARELMAMPDGEFCKALEAATGSILGRIEACSARADFPLRSGSASAYCGPGWALVGDAAHCVHPLAGQGVNLGFLDCAALVQVLVDAQPGHPGDHRVLRRYERWRKGENFAMLTALESLNGLFSNDRPALSFARRVGLTAVDHMAPVKRMFMQRALGLQGDLPDLVRKERSSPART